MTRWREIAALALLLLGGVLVPFFGWLPGVYLLWRSEAWSGAQKLLGTFVVPGGLLPLALLLTFGTGTDTRSCGRGFDPVTGHVGPTTCVGSSGDPSVLWIVVAVVLFAAPLAVNASLAVRMRPRQ